MDHANEFDSTVAGLAEEHSTNRSGGGQPAPMSRSGRTTLRRRLLGLAAVMAVPLVAVTATGVRSSFELAGHTDNLAGRAVPATLLAHEFENASVDAQLWANEAMLSAPGPERDKAVASHEENVTMAVGYLDQLRRGVADLDGEASRVDDIAARFEEWHAAVDPALTSYLDYETLSRLALDQAWEQTSSTAVVADGTVLTRALAARVDAERHVTAANGSFEAMRASLVALTESTYQQNMISELDQVESRASSAARAQLLTMVVGLLLAGTAGWFIARSISRSVARNTASLEDASAAVEQAASHLGQLTSTTAHRVGDVSDLSDTVATSISSVGQAIDGLSASIDEISHKAERASSVASEAAWRAKDTNATVAKLGASSEQIGEVIEVITSIAKQTNLLALNATIEAARAGESGKGFAVVANEVKELAKQTSAATEQISRQIATIQADTNQSVQAIEAITAVIDEIAEIQVSIASAVDEQTSATSEIARSVASAVESTNSITGTVGAVVDAAQGADREIDATLGAARVVQAIAAELRSLVGR
jgi:methyl-accepting chemotaxis protein